MLKKFLIISVVAFSASTASAQQADVSFMQRAITALQTQRNTALDQQAASEAKVSGLTEDLAKSQAKVKELEAKVKELEDKAKPKEAEPDKK
jgi:peptidoglycan hydrolase CwlO-like protein